MYGVKFVGDNDLPAGHDWLLARTAGRTLLFIREASMSPQVLEEAWAGFRLQQGITSVPLAPYVAS